MRFSTAVLSSLTVWVAQHAHVASAFGGPSRHAFVSATMQKRGISSTTQLHANVLKLSDPAKEVLDKTDVFIFDCDGVIWRVRTALCFYVCGLLYFNPFRHTNVIVIKHVFVRISNVLIYSRAISLSIPSLLF